MNSKILAITISMFLASCATVDSKEVYLQSGKKGLSIKCAANDMDSCHHEAGNQCKGSGYNVFNRREDNGNIIMTISCRD